MQETRPASDLLPWSGNELRKVQPGGFSSPLPSWDLGGPWGPARAQSSCARGMMEGAMLQEVTACLQSRQEQEQRVECEQSLSLNEYSMQLG